MLEARPKQEPRGESRLNRRGRRWPLYVLSLAAAVGLMAAAGLAVYLAVPFSGSNDQEKIVIGQGFVRNAIREDLRATFGSDEETRVEPLADNKFLIAGWVDVISEAGETDRQDFSCVIFKSEGDNWVGEKIAVISQHF